MSTDLEDWQHLADVPEGVSALPDLTSVGGLLIAVGSTSADAPVAVVSSDGVDWFASALPQGSQTGGFVRVLVLADGRLLAISRSRHTWLGSITRVGQ